MYILTCNWILFNYICIIIFNDWIRPGMNDKRKLNWLLQWFYFEFSQWMCSVVTHSHIGILNNALFSSLQTPLSAFQMSQKSLYCSERYFTSVSKLRPLHTVRNIARSSFKGGMRFLTKVLLKMWRKTWDLQKFIKNKFSERMSCEQLAIFPPKFCLYLAI